MIRFVDLTEALDPGLDTRVPCCAFFNTVTDRFIETSYGCHSFDDASDVESIVDVGHRERCKRFVPEGFWETNGQDE